MSIELLSFFCKGSVRVVRNAKRKYFRTTTSRVSLFKWNLEHEEKDCLRRIFLHIFNVNDPFMLKERVGNFTIAMFLFSYSLFVQCRLGVKVEKCLLSTAPSRRTVCRKSYLVKHFFPAIFGRKSVLRFTG